VAGRKKVGKEFLCVSPGRQKKTAGEHRERRKNLGINVDKCQVTRKELIPVL
jgi:hypothetical protein